MTYAQTNDIERTATEFRIQSNNDSGFNWILGAFKETNEKVTDVDYLQPGSTNPIFWEADLVRKGDIDAIFGEAYFDLSEKTSLTMGLRKYDQTMDLKASDGYYGSYAFGINSLDFNSSETGSIPKLSISHDISDDIMVYGSYSEGFRPSGVNRPRPSQAGLIPETYDPDYLDSYEIGVKSSLKDGRLILNGALYKMDWTDYQTSTYDTDITSVAYTENVGNAEINGMELNLMYAISDTADMTLYVNKMDPTLSEDYYYTSGELGADAGNRLAYMPELTYYLSFDKDFVFMGKPAYMNIDYSHTGERYTTYENGGILLPSYSMSNLRAGVDNDNSSIELYVTNLFDKDAYLSRYDDFESVGSSGYSGFGIRRTGSKPRVIGIRIRYRY